MSTVYTRYYSILNVKYIELHEDQKGLGHSLNDSWGRCYIVAHVLVIQVRSLRSLFCLPGFIPGFETVCVVFSGT